MKKLLSITLLALLFAAGVAGAETTTGSGTTPTTQASGVQQQAGPAEAAGKTTYYPSMADMGMIGMGQAMMPSMVNMMLSEIPPQPMGTGGKMMNMPMMGASMMPMGMGGMGMMPLMMGGTSAETAVRLDKYRAFLKETKAARKELHDLAFIYFEQRWTPETTIQQLQDTALKMRKLKDEIMVKMPK